MKHRTLVTLFAAAMTASMIFGTVGYADETEAASSAAPTSIETDYDFDGQKIGVFIAQNGNEFTMTVGQSAKEAGEALGAEVNVFDGQADQDTQVSQIETCITQGYSGLIVEPVTNDGLNEVLREAMDAGIPVVTVIQTCAVQDELTAFVGADYEEASYVEAKQALEDMGGEGKICLVKGQMGTSGEQVCTAGIERALEEYPDIEVLEDQAADWQTDKSLTIVETWLQKYSDIDGIICEDDPMAMGAVQACQDAGLTDIYIVGRNGDTDALQAIKDGKLKATVRSNPEGMGQMAVAVIGEKLNGADVASNYATVNQFIDASNVDEFLK